MTDVIVRDLRSECDVDIVGLWEVCAAVDQAGTPAPARRLAVLSICEVLVDDPDIRCALCHDGAFHVWPAGRDQAIERIATGYDAHRGAPDIGDVVYFATRRYLLDLIEPPVVWPSDAPAS